MKNLRQDFRYFLESDGISDNRIGNVIRIGRRLLKRTWFDKATIFRPRVFCQNSGACGSSYIVQLLKDNGIERCFHELQPDYNELGLQHFEHPVAASRLIRLLRYSRHDVFFEANNRLFSLSREIKLAFPNAKMIHLHRHPADAVASAMSKPEVVQYLDENVRFQGTLAGPKTLSPFERFCHYWTNMNRRIVDDLKGEDYLSLRFDDLVGGRIEELESFLELQLRSAKRDVVNEGRVRQDGRFPKFVEWSTKHKQTFENICGPLMRELGYE